MRGSVKTLVACGALMTAGQAAGTPAVAATAAPPTLLTQNFACSNSVCEVGPGNAGVSFSVVLLDTGGPVYTGPDCSPYLMSVVSGSLPPGLQLGEPGCTFQITGTPIMAGTYAFTVQITPQPNGLGQPAGPSGTQQLTITVGTGRSDRLVLEAARLNLGCGTDEPELQLQASDANSGATYTITATATGTRIATYTGSSASADPAAINYSVSSPSAFPSRDRPIGHRHRHPGRLRDDPGHGAKRLLAVR